MATLRERLAAAEAQLAFLAGAGLGGAVGRAGVRSTASTVGRAALATPQGRAVLAGISYTALKNELNARDLEFAEAELGPEFAASLELQQKLQPLPIPTGRLAVAGLGAVKKTRKKVTTKFNKAVSAGMKAVRMSTSYGGKNKISDAKKAFTQVTKTASKINKGAKVAKKGILRKIGLAVKKVLK
jgi:hypothetical protein